MRVRRPPAPHGQCSADNAYRFANAGGVWSEGKHDNRVGNADR